MHGYRYPAHEQRAEALARAIGFTQVTVGHEVSGLMKLVSRGDTTVVDAYLSPILGRYVDQVVRELGRGRAPLVHAVASAGLSPPMRFQRQGRDPFRTRRRHRRHVARRRSDRTSIV